MSLSSYKISRFIYIVILLFGLLSFVLIQPSSALFMDWYSGDKVFKYRLTGTVISYIDRFYVEPERLHPQHMLLEALAWTEKMLPELLVETSESSNALEIVVGESKKKLDTSRIQNVDDCLTLLKDSLLFVQTNLQETDGVKPNEIEYAAINGLLSDLDPHSILLPPKEYKEFRIGTSGRFGGLGMVVGIREMVLTVISPIEGTPAYRAGLKTGDKIMEIDGESTVNMSLYEAVSKLRGEPDTKVTLLVIREKSSEPSLVTLKREIIALPSVVSQVVEGGFCYLKVRNFQEDTVDDLDRHLQHLQKETSDLRGLVLDLRNNSGGLLDQAVGVSDRFLTEGIIVVTAGPGKRHREIQRAQESERDITDCPLVVIIDAGSASGSEIVAGALKENNRAVIIGDRSFGKGTVQQLIDMADGSALKLTVAKYLTPLYRDIQTKGITPDISLVPVVIGADTIQLLKGNSGVLREADMQGHLHGEPSLLEEPLETLKYLSAPEGTSEKEEEEDPYKPQDLSKDYQVQLALQFLKGTLLPSREGMLEELRPLLGEIKRTEEQKISEALGKVEIDWSEGKDLALPKPVATLSFEPPGEKIKAGETLTITLTLSNRGEGALYRMYAISESKNPSLDKLEFPLGKVEKGASKSYSQKVTISQNMLDRTDEFIIKFSELNGNIPRDLHSSLRVEALPRPQFAYSYQIVESDTDGLQPNDDGLVQRGEVIELLVSVKNIGEGKSTKNVVTLRNLSHKEVFVEAGSKELGELAPGETKTVSLRLHVRESLPVNEFTMDLVITDMTFGIYLTDKLTFPIMDPRVSPLLVEVSKGLQTTRGDTFIYGGRSTDSPAMVSLRKGTTLKADGWVPSWYRVRLPNGGRGWVPARDVAETTVEKESALELYVQRIPPIIEFKAPVSPVSSGRTVFSGTVRDDRLTKYLYIMVNNDKVYFKGQKKGGKDRELEFTAELPLKEGPNTVAVVAKDDTNLTSSKGFVVSARPALVKGEVSESK